MNNLDDNSLKKIKDVLDGFLTPERVMSDLRQFSAIPAVSGFEESAADSLMPLISACCDEVAQDIAGNILGFWSPNKDQTAPKLLISAHMDEIGLIVTGFDNDRFVRFTNIASIDPSILLSQEVIIHGKEKIPGIIAARPGHLLSVKERNKIPRHSDLSIDTGMQGDMLRSKVSVGDTVTYKPIFTELLNDRICTKCLDDRAGLTVMTETMHVLRELAANGINPPCNLYVAATKQEETGFLGGITAAYNVNPDYAIVLDANLGDSKEMPEGYVLGGGPIIAVGPILNKAMTKGLIKTAEELGMNYQLNPEPEYTGTEAWSVHVSRFGVPVAIINIPVRYMHSPVEMLQIDDVLNAVRLLTHYILNNKG